MLLALVSALAVTMSPIADEPSTLLKGVHRIVTMGDSITQGGGGPTGYVTLMTNWLRALYPEQNIEVINAGISGHKATDMQERFQRDVIDKKPDLVTISVGVNDVWHGFYDNHPLGDGPRGVPVPLYTEKVQAMIDASKAIGAKVVLLTPTLIHERLDSAENQKLAGHIAAMKELAKKNGCTFVDLNAAFRRAIASYQKEAGVGTLLLTTDGVHMNVAGNRMMAWTAIRGMGVSEKALQGAAGKP
jgi:lysophospholipase L1-like esterase